MPEETREYAVPLYSFPETADGETEGPKKPESEDEERIVVSYYEHQSGNDSLRAYHYHGDGTRDHYNFRVTEKKDSKWCGYTGDSPDDVPVDVLHAIHNFGYGIHNIETLGFWFSTLNEIEYGIGVVENIRREAEDEFINAACEKAIELYKIVRLGALIRFSLGEEQTKEIWRVVWDSMGGEVVSTDELEIELINSAKYGENDNLDGDINSVQSVPYTFESHRHNRNGKEIMAVDIITPFGINRVPFEKQDEDEYVLRRSHTPYKAPLVTNRMEYNGYEVSNAKTVLKEESETEKLGCMMKTLFKIDKDQIVEENELGAYRFVIGRLTLTILSLQDMLFSRKFDAELYYEKVDTVAEHLDVGNIAESDIDPEQLADISRLIARSMPSEVQEDIDDWIQTSGVFSNKMLEKYGLRNR